MYLEVNNSASAYEIDESEVVANADSSFQRGFILIDYSVFSWKTTDHLLIGLIVLIAWRRLRVRGGTL